MPLQGVLLLSSHSNVICRCFRVCSRLCDTFQPLPCRANPVAGSRRRVLPVRGHAPPGLVPPSLGTVSALGGESSRSRSHSRHSSGSHGRGVPLSPSASKSPSRQAAGAAPAGAVSVAVPALSPPEIPAQDAAPLITRAAAFRTKYRKHESVRLPISQVGFHPANREGQPPSSARCVSLLQEILDIGFDVGEASAGGVVVEAVATQAELEHF